MADANYTHEIWVPVEGYEGIYEVSDLGRVRSLDRMSPSQIHGMPIFKRIRGRILSVFYDKDGYHQVRLCKRDGGRSESIHRLVCRAFHGRRPTTNHMVAHGDGDKANNAADNLRWATAAENTADTLAHGTRASGETHASAKLTETQAREIRRRANAGEGCVKLGREFGISRTYARQIATGRRWACLED